MINAVQTRFGGLRRLGIVGGLELHEDLEAPKLRLLELALGLGLFEVAFFSLICAAARLVRGRFPPCRPS
jgi:hypothetical protein